MKPLCEIGLKISQIKITESEESKNGNPHAEKIFSILRPYANEYRKLEMEYGFFPEYYDFHPDKLSHPTQPLCMEEAINQLSKHPFVHWLNQQPGIHQAKQKIEKDKLTIVSKPKNQTIKEYRNLFALEFICSSLIHYFTNDKNKLSQIIGTKAKQKPILIAMKKLRYELNKSGGIHSEIDSQQHLLQILLNEMLKSTKTNPYNSEKKHPHILRHFLTKKVLQYLFVIYERENLSHISAVDIALQVTNVFFTRSMDRSDAVLDSKEILQNITEDAKFRQKTVANILAMEGLKQMKF
jgi:hypothetical protein